MKRAGLPFIDRSSSFRFPLSHFSASSSPSSNFQQSTRPLSLSLPRSFSLLSCLVSLSFLLSFFLSFSLFSFSLFIATQLCNSEIPRNICRVSFSCLLLPPPSLFLSHPFFIRRSWYSSSSTSMIRRRDRATFLRNTA